MSVTDTLTSCASMGGLAAKRVRENIIQYETNGITRKFGGVKFW